MDVFGTVATTIHLVHRLVGYIQAVRSAEEDRLKLLPEISALGAILNILHRRLGKSDSNDDNIEICCGGAGAYRGRGGIILCEENEESQMALLTGGDTIDVGQDRALEVPHIACVADIPDVLYHFIQFLQGCDL
ncbi:hypothetical protein BD779DRAFT_1483091 [Infundibulicybe gibba]|nr:hypothetical protein BD779DRAFT_1483091 [Infundibulicybe gibba]